MNKKNIEAIYPLSAPQQGMLFETLYSPEPGIHIEQLTGVFQGNLDISAFERAWQQVIDRHSVLRTCFIWKEQDEPLQVVLRQVKVPLEQLDWHQFSSSQVKEELEAFLQAERHQGINLSKAPLIRLALIHLGKENYQFICTHHHILMDGWSVSSIFQEFFAFYEAFCQGQDLHLEKPRPYRDYIAWLKKQDLSKPEAFWRKTLQGFTRPTPLGTTVESLSVADPEDIYGEQKVYLSAPATATLQSLAKQYRLTLNTVIQGVWALLLSHYSRQEDVVFGITVSGRQSDLEGVESMTGMLINSLPIRVKVSPRASFWFWLKDIQTYNVELQQYEYSPTGQIHQWSEVPGALSLYESLLVFENFPDISRQQSSVLSINISQTHFKGAQTKYALTLLVVPDSELRFDLIYDTRRFDRADVTCIQDHLIGLLENIVAAPEEQHIATLLDKIPANQIPKIRLLPKHEPDNFGHVFVAPRNPVEEVLAGIWKQILGVEQVGVDDNFFELGGHSLLATQVMSRVRDAFCLELPLRHLFESPTIASLAKQIEIVMRLEQKLETPAITRISRNGNLPLSFAQARLWLLEQLYPGSLTYNDLSGLRLVGSLNLGVLEQSLQEIIRRHEALRTTFYMVNGQPFQAIACSLTIKIPVVDLRELPEAQKEAVVQQLITEESQRCFDLVQGPLLRCTLLRIHEQEHIVLFTIHHIVSDGWSMGVFVQELATLYEVFCAGKPSPLSELPIQYADFAIWQKQWLQGEVLEAQLSYWKKQLGSNLPILQLPTVRPRAEVKTSPCATQFFNIPSNLSQQLQALTRQEGATLFMTLLAGFQILLQLYTQQDDIIVGTDVANRNRAEIESLIGFFVNLLVLRTDLSGNPSFRELLGRVREVALGAYAHQDLPFEKLVEVLQPERNLSNTSPLFQVLFVLQNAPMPTLELPGLTLSFLEIQNKIARFDLALFLTETEQGILGKLQYNAELFDAATITRMTNHFQTLLNSIVSQPDVQIGNLEMLTEAERNQQVRQKRERKAFNQEKLIGITPKAISSLPEKLVETCYFQTGQTFPLVIKPASNDIDLIAWSKMNQEFLDKELLKHGAILFRDFNIESVLDFENFAQVISPDLFDEYGDLPRTGEGGKVYGSTPYPPKKAILFHNESSHLHQWPLKIWFFCIQVAQQGGETPIIDCRKAYKIINPKLRERLAQKQLMYVRHYTKGLDVSWQNFFRSNDKLVVENYCRQARINFEWYNNSLITRQVRPALAVHPKTSESVFFNQIQLHHIAYLDAEVRESLLSTFGDKQLPRNVYYGDGTPIEDSVIAEINEVYQQCQTSFSWQQGDILMLDNMLIAHGRNPYVGSRKIVVAMGEMIKEI
ncbi:condensation domain-containing protein [Nostoc punctiforme]|uniref:Condensation domain protein n=1 Tax=Nostoc punctiforme (strain ATCC 29133 / PCC 73102) TaxID=63737 RepID=B2J0Z5_NOSP7|nr:condensation domain-containing protein [Nostoc punctiforme]ACC81846.1 condensation domain protein [Nostoc punctiforme PCC 73102]